MANDRIKGLTVEIGGDTTKLTDALKATNNQIKDTQTQLRDVERLLKLDPTNTELLRQKQELLAKAIAETNEKLGKLKDAESKAQEQFKKGEISQKQYDGLKREIIDTEESLKKLEKQQKEANGSLNEFKIAAENAKAALGKIGDAADAVASKTKAMSLAATAGLAAIGKGAYDVITMSDDLNTLAKQTGFTTEELQKMQYAADLIDVSQETITGAARKMTMGLKSVAESSEEAEVDLQKVADKELNLEKAQLTLEAAQIAYSEAVKKNGEDSSAAATKLIALEKATLDVEKATGELNEAKAGERQSMNDLSKAYDRLGVSVKDTEGNYRDVTDIFYDTIDALSKIENETERDSLAMTIFGKSANDLAGIVDDGGAALKELGQQAEDLGLILSQETLDDLNETNDKIDTMKANIKGVLALNAAKLVEEFSPVLEKIIDKIGKMVEWLGNLDAKQLETITVVLAAVAAISPVAKLVSGITTVVEGLTSAVAFLLANPIVAAIAAVVAAIVLVATKGDWLKEKLQQFDDWLQGIFSVDFTETFGALGEPINAFFRGIKNTWDAIKKIFDGIIDFIYNIFRGNWKEAWEGIKEIFSGVLDFAEAKLKNFANGFIWIANVIIDGINLLIRGLNKISFELPDWIPGIGGKTFGININEIGKIPLLANGGTVAKGMAIVGEAGPELLNVTNGLATVRPLTTGKTGGVSAITLNVNNTINGYDSAKAEGISRDIIHRINVALGGEFS